MRLGKPLAAFLPVFLAGAGFCQNTAAPSSLSKTVGTYCIACHNPRLAENGVRLDPIHAQQPWTDPDTWERVLRQLRARTMPPAGNPRPSLKAYEAMVGELAGSLDRGDPARPQTDSPPASDAEIASRLAKLLWSTFPDAQLLDLVRKKQLHDPVILETQVRRMLADPKSNALVIGFFDGWLGLDQLAAAPADPAAFPEFDAGLRDALKRETELFVASQLREDRPAMELWTANFTYLNDRLAKLYGIANVSGPEFRRVSLPGEERAGLLGQGSFLVTTSILTKHEAVDQPSTSPARRARWIWTHFLGLSMREPLPNPTPMLKGVLLSAQLRSLPDPSCDACHSNFLPLGYALENFDPLGRWRTEADHEPIDVSGAFADGMEFNGPAELRQALLSRKDAFLNTITQRLLAYALDGKPGFAKATPAGRMPGVRKILREAASKNYTWSALLGGIVLSAAN